MKPHAQAFEDVIYTQKTSQKTGLSENEVKKRQRQYGLNLLKEKPQESWAVVFIKQFQSPLIYILLIAAVIIFVVGQDPLDAFIISGVLFLMQLLVLSKRGVLVLFCKICVALLYRILL